MIMGKKLNQALHKISKDHRKQQFNNLIKVLRPKVYIIDSSSFKKLVQELTGNGSSTTLSYPPPLEPNMVENCPIIEGAEVQREPETSVEVSVSTEVTTTSSELCYTTSLMNEEYNKVCNQICLEDSVFQDSMSMANHPQDHLWESYQNLESLLFDVEPNPFHNCYAQFEQEVSIYDYELSGLL